VDENYLKDVGLDVNINRLKVGGHFRGDPKKVFDEYYSSSSRLANLLRPKLFHLLEIPRILAVLEQFRLATTVNMAVRWMICRLSFD
jgi:hypothetical protein